jgi:hypothetical protein
LIKDGNGQNHPWNPQEAPLQAIYVDIDHNYAASFSKLAARLWKNEGRNT